MTALDLTAKELAVLQASLRIIQERVSVETGKGNPTVYSILDKIARLVKNPTS